MVGTLTAAAMSARPVIKHSAMGPEMQVTMGGRDACAHTQTHIERERERERDGKRDRERDGEGAAAL